MSHLYEPHPECEIPSQLSPQDVGYIVGAKQNFEITKKRLAAIDSGFFSAFGYFYSFYPPLHSCAFMAPGGKTVWHY